MSGINSAFNIARSGLTINSQWSEIVSGNIANAGNADYGRRTLSRTSTESGNVLATGVQRAADASLTRMYREELARAMRQDALSTGLTAYTTGLGSLDDPNSPMQLLNQFQTSFDFLFNDPGQTSLQQATLQSAQSLARGLNRVSNNLDTAVGGNPAASGFGHHRDQQVAEPACRSEHQDGEHRTWVGAVCDA